jgi:hypothetical protein
MSKLKIGKWDTGEPKYIYFRKHKHYRVKENGFKKIRWLMYLAHEIKWDSQFYKKYN